MPMPSYGYRPPPKPPVVPPAGDGPTVPTHRATLAWQCGQASLAAPLVAWVLGCLAGASPGDGAPSAGVLLAVRWGLLGFGLAAAVVALAGIRRHGRKGLLVPGVVGLLMNGMMIAVSLYALSRPAPPPRRAVPASGPVEARVAGRGG